MARQPSTFIYENLFFDESDPNQPKPPYLHGDYWLVNGEMKKWNGPVAKVNSPIFIKGKNEPVCIGISHPSVFCLTKINPSSSLKLTQVF
jgi:hypothetical protein